MLKKITAQPYFRLLLVCCILFLVKNIYFFYYSYTHSGTWGINRSVSWLWEGIEITGMPALQSVCLVGALLFAIRAQRKQALYFVAVLLLLFPFQTFIPVSYRYDGFYLMRREQDFSERLISAITDYGHWALLVLFLAGMFLSHKLKKSAIIFYWLLFALNTMLIACFDIPQIYDGTHIGLYLTGIFFGGIGAWMFVVLNYFNYINGKILRNILFYFSVAICLTGIYNLWLTIPIRYDIQVLLPLLLSILGSLVLLLLYHLRPQHLITLFVPAIPLISGVITIFYCILFPMLVKFGSAMNAAAYWPGNVMSWLLPACLVPVLLAPLFRERSVAAI